MISRGTVRVGEADVSLREDAAHRARIGCIQLPTDLTLEVEGPALFARVPRVGLRLQKLVLDGDSLDAENYGSARGRITEAAQTLRPRGSVDAIGVACTSLAFTLGPDEVQRELRTAHPGASVTDMATALLAGLDALGLSRVALLTPYGDDLHRRTVEFLEQSGRTVVRSANLGLVTDGEISALSTDTIADLVRAVDDDGAEAVVVACSAFRATGPGFIDALEDALGKPVLTSQQAFLWHLLRLAGVQDAVGGYGRLFTLGLAEPYEIPRIPPVPFDRDEEPFDREEDVYPSRVPDPGFVERRDPVVAASAREAGGPLDAAALDRFEERGALVLRSVFDPEEVAHLSETVERLRDHYEGLSYDELDRTTDMRVITERGGTLVGDVEAPPTLKSVWQIHLPEEHAPHMLFAAELARRAVCDARLVGVAQQILGEDVYVHQSRINFQRGMSRRSAGGSGFLWHQDFEQWHSEDGMPRMRAVSMAVLLERAQPANGALMVIPGSHRRLLQAYRDRTDGERYAKGALSRGPELPAEHLRELADRHGIEYCRGEPGDVVLFDCNTVHGSHTNISPWGRSMFFAVYNAVSNTPASKPFGAPERRPEHIGCHDPRLAGVPLPALQQSLAPALAWS